MKKINFSQHVLPHLFAVLAFLIVTAFFFSPVFFDNKVLIQSDVAQSGAMSKAISDYRATGDEALWAPNAYSGMPAYLVSVQWGYTAVNVLKAILTLGISHPVCNIFLAFICYYILLLTFRIRPYLAIAGALAFGLSTFMIIGLGAGHNGRIGATAVVPLVIAGIHLTFSGKRFLGFGVTAAALALHLRENHLQVTYYMIFIVLGYGLMQLIVALREKKVLEFAKTVVMLIPAALLAAGSFFAPLWAIQEYSKVSTRGKNELVTTTQTTAAESSGMNRDKAFAYSNGILEPMTLLIPNFYGGSSQDYLVKNRESETYQALARAGNEQLANQLAQYSTPYWGAQPIAAPYYGGAIIAFLFVVGIIFAERKYTWWLVSISAFAIVLSWGKNFESINYFFFDYLPGYNKFRSVTFGLMMTFLAMPLLGLLGLEKLLQTGINTETKKKLWIAFGLTGGVCLLLIVFGGMMAFMREDEAQFPAWFLSALQDDRKSLLRSDAIRSFFFIVAVFIVLYFNLVKKVAPWIVYTFIAAFVLIDVAVVDKRYFAKENYKRKSAAIFAPRASEEQVLKDKGYYRVLSTDFDARASYFFNSITGYHGAPIRRYQDAMDSCLQENLSRLQPTSQQFNDPTLGFLNMTNCKYILFGEKAGQYLVNEGANGPAWFVRNLVTVNSPTEELANVNKINTATTAVLDVSKFKAPTFQYDSASTIINTVHQPKALTYQAQSAVPSLAVFSEVYYADGWVATIDGQEAPILRVNYILRALEIPAGNHVIEFTFEPKAYIVGNKITMASSWILLIVLLASIAWSLRKEEEHVAA